MLKTQIRQSQKIGIKIYNPIEGPENKNLEAYPKNEESQKSLKSF